MVAQDGTLTGFTQLIGQSALARRLLTALEQDRIAHAVIFAGPPGSGKRTAASIYARALLCRGEGRKPCDICPSCRKVFAGSHPDLHVVKPKEGEPYGVDVARALQSQLYVRPYEGGRVVIIVENAHELTVPAQNALLKTLEEPPGHAVLMLLAETLSPLLPTVLSRCAVYKMARLSPGQMISVLTSRGYESNARTAHAAAMGDGRPGRALQLLEDGDYWELKDRAMAVLEGLVAARRLAGAIRFAQDNRDRAADILTIWECALRDAAVMESRADAPPLTAEAPAFLAKAGLPALERMLSACVAARKALDGNAIYSITMDNLFIALSGGF